MKTFNKIAALAAAGSVLASPSAAEELSSRSSSTTLPAVSVKGNAFFADGERFFIRGLDYQPGGSSQVVDPLADEDTCKRDIAEFKKLGLNTIRVYTVDNSANHDTCMQLLADAGIYLVLDVNTPKYSINRAEPAASYNAVYLQSVFATIDAFHSYTNTLAFFSGNEVINDDSTTSAAPYVKATTRDMRQYIRDREYRSIPVGYSAADVDSNRYEMATYMNCGTDDERSDFFAFNDYSYCDPSSFTQSGWDQKVVNFTGYGIPIFLSEFGCITNTRTFGAVAALYNEEMTSVYSGGLVYEYSDEGNGYGVVNISDNTVVEGSQFELLKAAYAGTANPTGDGGYNATSGASVCPAYSSTWNVTGDSLPAIPAKAAAYMKTGAGTGPGLTGSGSQDASGSGVISSGTASAGSGQASVTATASTSASTSSSSSSTTHTSVATTMKPVDVTPFVVSVFVLGCTLFGSLLL